MLSGNRLTAFDNLRYLCVLFVVVEHSANAYNGLSWWAVANPQTSLLARGLSLFSDVFAMPLLFYIAGYFALPSLQSKGIGGFLKSKFKRLGAPWLVCILTVCPIVTLIYHYTRDGFRLTQGYWDLWLEVMHNALIPGVGVVAAPDQAGQNFFSQRYMWFLSLLLLFFLLFALLYAISKRWLSGADKVWTDRPATIKSTLFMFIGIGLLTTLLSFSMVTLIMVMAPKLGNPEPFFNLFSLIQFRPSRLFFYLVYFILGVMTYRNRWLQRGWFPGHLKTWALGFVILLGGLFAAYVLLFNAPPQLKGIYAPIYFLILNFLCAACLGLFVAVGLEYWNRAGRFDRTLAANSYEIYLSHYVFVLTGQLILLPLTAIPATVKFLMVAASSGLLAYLASQLLVRPHPRVAALAAFGLLAIMALVIHP